MLLEIEDHAREYSVKDLALHSEGGGGSRARRQAPLPPTLCGFFAPSATNRNFEIIAQFWTHPKVIETSSFFKTDQKLKNRTLDRQGLDFQADLDHCWRALFHHCSRPPNFILCNMSPAKVVLIPHHTKSITNNSCFLSCVSGTSFFDLFLHFFKNNQF